MQFSRKTIHIICLIALFYIVSLVSNAQNSQQEYLESNPSKAKFDQKQWGNLKGKMKQESSGNPSGKGEDFNSEDFSSEQNNQEDVYDFDVEDYKGQYSEYQNYEDPENDSYEYNEEYDNYEAQENYYQQKDYDDGNYNSYEKKKDVTPPSKPKRRKKSSPPSGPSNLSGFMQFLVYLGYAVIIAVVIFIVYKLILNYNGNEEGAVVEMNFDDVPPSEIPKTELERRLEEALAREDYREAVRIYFIFIIKDLSMKNWITWERKKTNMSYLIEMRSKSQFNLFNETVSIYDIVWYGNYTITKTNFHEVEPKFKQLLAEIHQ